MPTSRGRCPASNSGHSHPAIGRARLLRARVPPPPTARAPFERRACRATPIAPGETLVRVAARRLAVEIAAENESTAAARRSKLVHRLLIDPARPPAKLRQQLDPTLFDDDDGIDLLAHTFPAATFQCEVDHPVRHVAVQNELNAGEVDAGAECGCCDDQAAVREPALQLLLIVDLSGMIVCTPALRRERHACVPAAAVDDPFCDPQIVSTRSPPCPRRDTSTV